MAYPLFINFFFEKMSNFLYNPESSIVLVMSLRIYILLTPDYLANLSYDFKAELSYFLILDSMCFNESETLF